MASQAAILIVDDRAEDRGALDALLSGLGHPVIQASSGEEALGHLLKQPVAVILLDIRMPVMDGFETAALIRKRKASQEIPIIFLTAADQRSADVDRAYLLGAVDYLSKPVHPDVLRTKVRVLVDLFLRTRQLDEKAAELEAFSSTVAHDLRAPLRAIRTYSMELLEDARSLSDGHQFARRILKTADRMDALIQGLLFYSRMAREELRSETLDLEAVAERALSEISTDVKEKFAEVTLERPLSRVTGNGFMLTQVLVNLLANAIKFVAKDVTPRVRLRAERRGRVARLWVEDNGVGIDREDRAKLFRMFERLTTCDVYPGVGLGLAIVRRCMERMGGDVGVESEPGRGSRFWIELPAANGT